MTHQGDSASGGGNVQDARSQPDSVTHEVKATPTAGERYAECKALADRCEPLTPEGLAEFNYLRAREMARAEARRRAPSPQQSLDLAA